MAACCFHDVADESNDIILRDGFVKMEMFLLSKTHQINVLKKYIYIYSNDSFWTFNLQILHSFLHYSYLFCCFYWINHTLTLFLCNNNVWSSLQEKKESAHVWPFYPFAQIIMPVLFIFSFCCPVLESMTIILCLLKHVFRQLSHHLSIDYLYFIAANKQSPEHLLISHLVNFSASLFSNYCTLHHSLCLQ